VGKLKRAKPKLQAEALLLGQPGEWGAKRVPVYGQGLSPLQRTKGSGIPAGVVPLGAQAIRKRMESENGRALCIYMPPICLKRLYASRTRKARLHSIRARATMYSSRWRAHMRVLALRKCARSFLL
jgi:hypothetical protein